MALCRTCGKDTGTRYLWDDEYCSPECAFPEKYRQAEGQLDLFDDEEKRPSVGVLFFWLAVFLFVLYLGFSLVEYIHG